MTVSHRAVTLTKVGPGSRFPIVGAGPNAQGTALFARLADAELIVVTGFEDRARFAVLRELGFENLIDRSESRFTIAKREATQ